MELYFENIVEGLENLDVDIGSIKKLKILTPYITSPVLKAYIDGPLKHCDCVVYTSFKAEGFVTGKSDLKMLKKLIRSGVKIYAIEDLSANIILVPEVFATFGSGNMGSSAFGFASNAIVYEKEILCEIESKVATWVEKKIEITQLMVEQMEDATKLAREQFDGIFEDCERIDTWERRKVDLRGKTEAYCVVLSIDGKRKFCSLKNVKGDGGEREILVPSQKTNFLEWEFKKQPVHLSGGRYYFLINKETGQIGWVKLAKTRLSFAQSWMGHDRQFELGGVVCSAKLNALWTPEDLRQCNNLEIRMSHPQGIVWIRVCFLMDFLSINEVQIISGKDLYANPEFVERWVRTNQRQLLENVRAQALSSFLEDTNIHLCPLSEFDALNSAWSLRLADASGYEFLVSEKRSW